MRSRRTKVIHRTARGWTKPKPSGLTFCAFRGRMWFAGVSGGTVKFSETDPSVRYWIGVDHGTIDYSAETTYTNTVGGVTVGIDYGHGPDIGMRTTWLIGDDRQILFSEKEVKRFTDGLAVIKPRFIAASTPHMPGGGSLFEMWNRVKGGKP